MRLAMRRTVSLCEPLLPIGFESSWLKGEVHVEVHLLSSLCNKIQPTAVRIRPLQQHRPMGSMMGYNTG